MSRHTEGPRDRRPGQILDYGISYTPFLCKCKGGTETKRDTSMSIVLLIGGKERIRVRKSINFWSFTKETLTNKYPVCRVKKIDKSVLYEN